jgi:predicted PurR-regulated permease PerM
MKQKLRRTKHGKKKRLAIFVLVALLSAILAIFLYSTYWAKKPLFISPIASNSQKLTKKLEKLLLDSGIDFSSITSQFNSSYMVRLKEDGEAILSLEKDFKKQIASLQAVLKQLTIEGKRLTSIDFRFDKPVITIRE